MTSESQPKVSSGQYSDLNYGEQINLYRRRAKVTQKSLGGNLDITESEMSRVENGERLLTQDKADSLADFLSGKLLDSGIKGLLEVGYRREVLLKETSQKLATILRHSVSTEGLELLSSLANTPEGTSAILGAFSQILDSENNTGNNSNS